MMNELLVAEVDGSLKVQADFKTLMLQFERLQRDYGLVIPVHFISLFRSISILEGIALQRNPHFQLVQAAYPFVLEQLLNGAGAQTLTS
jgi:predicted unusual protein kinase regulating ubiquinone biosynthesis (AarF/ABC1/UbiB family)